jgi:hypothetical protein
MEAIQKNFAGFSFIIALIYIFAIQAVCVIIVDSHPCLDVFKPKGLIFLCRFVWHTKQTSREG